MAHRFPITMLGLLLSLAHAPGALAKSDVELGLLPLSLTSTKTKSKLENGSVESDVQQTRTLDPKLGLNIYDGRVMMGLALKTGAGSQAGTVSAGYAVAPRIYVGGAVSIDNETDETTTSAGAGASVKTETSSSRLGLAPFVLYRGKSGKSLIEAQGLIVRLASEQTEEAGGAKEKTAFTVIALQAGGSFHYQVLDRLSLGAGLTFLTSLSGDIEVERNGQTTDGDYETTIFSLELLSARLTL